MINVSAEIPKKRWYLHLNNDTITILVIWISRKEQVLA